MLDTALAQLRFATSLAFGLPFAPWSLDRLIKGLQATKHEFGPLVAPEMGLPGSVPLDDETRCEMQWRRFRSQAVRAARETAYYGRLFNELDIDPAQLRAEDVPLIPLTPKTALQTCADEFVRFNSKPYLQSMTTGTTGQPTSVYFSAYELKVMASLTAIGFLVRGEVNEADIVHIATTSRATLGNTSLVTACSLVGATYYQAGLIHPAQALALLAEERLLPGKEGRASVLVTYPSYLGQLVECGCKLGYRPADFGLDRISVGGEIVTAGLRERCQRLFGPVHFSENYALTETAPLGGSPCSAGHLHFEPVHGLVEVHNHETGTVAQPGELGTIVATPFAPFRDTSVLLRYDTEDIVRALAPPFTCELRHLPATSPLLGKRRFAIRHDDGFVLPRDVLESLEATEAVPLPARCSIQASAGGVAIQVVVREDTPAARHQIETSLEARGLPVRSLQLVEDRRKLQCPLPLRGDLRELSFGEALMSGEKHA